MTPESSDRRGALSMLLGAGAAVGLAQDAAIGGPAVPPRALLNVMDFGAKGDGIADDTFAFVAALSAAREANREHNGVSIPPGTFRVDGPVAMRPGQSLTGSGYATLIDARRSEGTVFLCTTDGDPASGGPPAAIARLRGLGGSGSAPFIRISVAGFALTDMFLSGPGIGISLDGAADGIVSGINIDQGLNGIVVRNSQNLLLSAISMFDVAFGLTFSGACGDIVLSGSQFCYARRASVLAADGASVRGLLINGCTFTSNAQLETFLGHVHCRAATFDGSIVGSAFANWRGFAIRQGLGGDVRLSIASCAFDGLRTNPLYNQSLDAAVIECGPGGNYSFSECDFRNLKGPLAALGVGPGRLSVSGGALMPGPAKMFAAAVVSRTSVSIDRCPSIATVDGCRVDLPVWPTWSGWRLNIAASGKATTPIYAEYIIVPDRGDGARVVTVWSSVASALPPTATRGRDVVSIDFPSQGSIRIDAAASTVP